MTSVLITVPTEGYVHKFVVAVLMRMQRDARYKLRTIMPTHRPLENNLHRIIRDLLKHEEDYWMNIDDDNPPMRNPLDLIALDLDVVCLPTPVWYWEGKEKSGGNRPIYLNAYKAVPNGYTEWPKKEGLQEVDAIGGGCFIAARRVFEHPAMKNGCFARKLYPDGTVDLGNDLSFSERAKEAGFKLWAHYDYQCRHFHEMELQEIAAAMSAFFEELQKRDG